MRRFDIINFLFIVLVINHVASDCQDWEPFKTEKCYKIIKDRQFTFESAKTACQEMKNSSLLVIENAEEQQFLKRFVFEVNKVLDIVWIGLRKNKITGQFEWVDNTALKYNNWARDYPKNKSGYDCVEMDPHNDGSWINFDCNKKNAVVCQRQPEMTIDEMKTMMMRMQRRLKQSKSEVEKLKNAQDKTNEKLKQVDRLAIPIGFIYVQLSSQPEPKSLFPNTEWSDISQQYAGLFFRTLGGSSAPFGQVQGDASPRIIRANSSRTNPKDPVLDSMKMFDPNPDGTTRWTAGGWMNEWGIYMATQYGEDYRFIRFELSLSEVRPKNTAVRIWKRVK